MYARRNTMSKKLPEDVKLRRSIRRSIESKKNYLDKPNRENYRQIISVFLEKFILCEVGTKRAIQAYYINNGDTRDIEDVNMPLYDIRIALSKAGFSVDSMSLEKMFKKNNKRGEKSMRDLRNAIAHDLTANDIQELVDRWVEIQELLNSYLNQLQSEPLE